MTVIRFPAPALPMRTTSYSEAAYYNGEHCQHIADYEEKHPVTGRLAVRFRAAQDAAKRHSRRGFGR